MLWSKFPHVGVKKSVMFADHSRYTISCYTYNILLRQVLFLHKLAKVIEHNIASSLSFKGYNFTEHSIKIVACEKAQ